MQNSGMNYNQVNRNSLISCIYSDRQGYPVNPSSDSWKNTPNEQHLNPSKSKVNVRQSLNKTTENYSSVNPAIASIRNSCLLNTSFSTHNPQKDAFQEDKYFKAAKENQDPVFPSSGKEHTVRYSQVGLTVPFQERKRSDSAHLRSCSNNDFLLKLDNQFRHFEVDKSEKGEKVQKTQNNEQLREMIIALTKRVATNEEEIGKLKEKSEKDKRLQGLESEISEYKGKMFELAKFNSKNFMDFQNKLQQSQHSLNQLREKLFSVHSNEDFTKKMGLLENKVNQHFEGMKARDENIEKKLVQHINNTENGLRKWIGQQISNLKNGLQSSKKQANQILIKMKKIQLDFNQKLGNSEDWKKSNKKCMNSLTVESKQILVIREGELIRDRTKQYINYPQSSRQFIDQPQRQGAFDSKKEIDQPKRELIIKQKLYYLDTNGYLLDQNKYYLLNSKNQQILLPDHLINCLKENNILTPPLRR